MQIWQLLIILRHLVTITIAVFSNPTNLTNGRIYHTLAQQMMWLDQKLDLQALYLSGTYFYKTGTRPPSYIIPREPTIYTFATIPILCSNLFFIKLVTSSWFRLVFIGIIKLWFYQTIQIWLQTWVQLGPQVQKKQRFKSCFCECDGLTKQYKLKCSWTELFLHGWDHS